MSQATNVVRSIAASIAVLTLALLVANQRSPVDAQSATNCTIGDTAGSPKMEITQGIQYDPRGLNAKTTVPYIKYRRTTVRVYLSGDCGANSVSGLLTVREEPGHNVVLGPLNCLNSVTVPSNIMFVNRDSHGTGIVPLSCNVWPWENSDASTLTFEVAVSPGTTPSGGPVTVSESVDFEAGYSPRISAGRIDYQPPITSTTRQWAGKPPEQGLRAGEADKLVWSVFPFPEPCGAPDQYCTSGYDFTGSIYLMTRHLDRVTATRRLIEYSAWLSPQWPDSDYHVGFLKGDPMRPNPGRSLYPSVRNDLPGQISAGFVQADEPLETSFRTAHEAGHGMAGLCHNGIMIGETGWDYFNSPALRDDIAPFVQVKDANYNVMYGSSKPEREGWIRPPHPLSLFRLAPWTIGGPA